MSFSGGKDSTVLLHLVKELYPDVPAVFCDTGLEYPEVRKFALKKADIVIKPKLKFTEVISNYGYPVISKEQALYLYELRNSRSEQLKQKRIYGDEKGRFKISNKWLYLKDADFKISHHCCNIMKKYPFKKYEKESMRKPYVGSMAEESSLRLSSYIKFGCNAFESSRPMSKPLSVWLEQDVLEYIVNNKLDYASVYGEIMSDKDNCYICTGAERTGCIFCAFGAHLDAEPNRFQKLKETHPRQYDYLIGGGEYNEDGIWIPNKEGLGMKHVLDKIGVKYK